MKCVKDCEPGSHLDSNGDCGGIADPWFPLFPSVIDCCNAKLSWLDANECAANSHSETIYTNKFYVGEP